MHLDGEKILQSPSRLEDANDVGTLMVVRSSEANTAEYFFCYHRLIVGLRYCC